MLAEAVAEHGAMGTQRIVIGPSDPTRDDLRPCEYLVYPSRIMPGRPVVTALVELGDDDRAAIAAGARLVLHMDGHEVPWELAVRPPT